MRVLLAGRFSLAFAACGAAPPTPPRSWRCGGTADRPEVGHVVTGAVVLVEKGRVTAVGPTVAIPAGARVIDLSGMTVLPGLIDCHTHLVGDYVDDKDPLSELKSSSAARAFESIPNARSPSTPDSRPFATSARTAPSWTSRCATRSRRGTSRDRACSSRART